LGDEPRLKMIDLFRQSSADQLTCNREIES
jgi:hypothetical protein